MKEFYNGLMAFASYFVYMAISHCLVVYSGSASWTSWVLLFGFVSIDKRISEALNKLQGEQKEKDQN
jgi:hypothetical protein